MIEHLIEQVKGHSLECCRRTITAYALTHHCALPAVGFTMPCRHCLLDLTWTGAAWERERPLWLKESDPEPTAQRHARANEITRGAFGQFMREGQPAIDTALKPKPFAIPDARECQTCRGRSGYVDVTQNGLAVFMCASKHVTMVDFSKDLGLR